MFTTNSKLNQFGLLALAVVALWAIDSIPSASAIHCWQCNTIKDKFCESVPAGPVADVSTLDKCFQDLYKECVSDDPRINFTFCRKQEQTIDSQRRLIRGCGFERSASDCYQTRNPPILTTVCQCDGDGCNGASNIRLSAFGLLTILVTFFLNRFLLF